VLAAGLAAAVAGCAGSRGAEDVRASRGAVGGAGELDALAATYAQDMADLSQAGAAAEEGGAPAASRSGVFVERAPGGAGADESAGTGGPDGVGAVEPASADAGAPAGEPGERGPAIATENGPDVETLARDLGRALRARGVNSATPYEDLSRVAMLEAIAPGVLEGLGETAEEDAADLVAALAPSERDALRAARRTALALAASGAADPSVAADALRAAAESLEESQVIRIAGTALCRRVDGFARYEAFSENTFLAGRTNAMIVYAEIDRFRQQPLEGAAGSGAAPGVPPGARFSTRLTQSLNLYFSDGGLLVWRRPPQTVVDYAASRLRDFYIIDTIELPATLAAGSYSLKVVVKDEATGEQAEAIIPISLVAEAGLARGG
jgi:hypothetical protein